MLRGLRRGLWGLFWRGRGCIDALTVDGRLEKKKGCVWARYNFVGLAKAFSGWGIAAFGACIRRHELRREVVVQFFFACVYIRYCSYEEEDSLVHRAINE